MGSRPHSLQSTASNGNYSQQAISGKELPVSGKSKDSFGAAVKIHVTLALMMSVVLG